jgi:hypothetical protein
MEVATRFGVGRHDGAALARQSFEAIIASQGLSELPLGIDHAGIGRVR